LDDTVVAVLDSLPDSYLDYFTLPGRRVRTSSVEGEALVEQLDAKPARQGRRPE